MKLEHPFYQNSMCKGKHMHRFQIIDEDTTGVQEMCQICKKKIVHKLLDGRADNRKYMSYHLKQAIPNFHPFYAHEYPKIQE